MDDFMKILILLFKVYKRIYKFIVLFFEQIISYILLKLNGVKIGLGFRSLGIPCVDVSLGGKFEIGNNLFIQSGNKYNQIGRQQRCFFVVKENGKLKIGNNVGMSSTAIICDKHIQIGDFVKIGGNVVIYDTDFHSLDSNLRHEKMNDYSNTNRQDVIIENNVFIGAHSTILKGVCIGENSIIGACSVVTKSIPRNEIWGGNPAKFIRAI
jgi:acetyltransferase-like isoleucine patch superfamily enzyme